MEPNWRIHEATVIDLPTFQDEVIKELRLLQGRLPEWYPTGPYADHLRPLDPLERREAARLDRLLRQERAAWGERGRERAMREHAHAWREQDRWTLRKRVWRERRDRERELLEQREQTLLEREAELLKLRAHHQRWLQDLQALDPTAQEWCAEQARTSEQQGITPELLDQLHGRRAQAAEQHARALLDHAEIRAILRTTLPTMPRDPFATSKMLTALLAEQAIASIFEAARMPVVVAALALLIEREGASNLMNFDDQIR